jgi:hypothetical protein
MFQGKWRESIFAASLLQKRQCTKNFIQLAAAGFMPDYEN